MSDLTNAIDYFSNSAKNACHRGSTGKLEDELSHVESLVDYYVNGEPISLSSKDGSVGSLESMLSDLYKVVYRSAVVSRVGECKEIVHRSVWSTFWSTWDTGHYRLLEGILDAAVSHYIHEFQTDQRNEIVEELFRSNFSTALDEHFRVVHHASTLSQLNNQRRIFSEIIFPEIRRIARDPPKSGVIEPFQTVFELLNSRRRELNYIEHDLYDYQFDINQELRSDDPDRGTIEELKNEMGFVARKYRLLSEIDQAVKSIQFVGSAWITHLASQGFVEVERWEIFHGDIIAPHYTKESGVAEQFLELTPGLQGYWESWELRRKMEASPGDVVAGGSGTWEWVLDFYIIQMIRLIIEAQDFEFDEKRKNPIPSNEILRLRTDTIVDRIESLRDNSVLKKFIGLHQGDEQIEEAANHLIQLHRTRETEMVEQWEQKIRAAPLDEGLIGTFQNQLPEEIFSKFTLRNIFDSNDWLRSNDELPENVELRENVLLNTFLAKRRFVDDPLVAQHIRLPRLSSQLAVRATHLWLDELAYEEVVVEDVSEIVHTLHAYSDEKDSEIIVVNSGDVRREVVESREYSVGTGDDVVSVKNEKIMGHFGDIPVITTDLGDVMAVIVERNDQAIYEKSTESPIFIEFTLGEEWAENNPETASEFEDLEEKVLLTVTYTFGSDGGNLVVFHRNSSSESN